MVLIGGVLFGLSGLSLLFATAYRHMLQPGIGWTLIVIMLQPTGPCYSQRLSGLSLLLCGIFIG